MLDLNNSVALWANSNQGILGLVIFLLTLFIGWVSGIFSALRRKPKFRIKVLDGPSFACTFGTGGKHGAYDEHRTGFALYLNISNVGSSPASIENVAMGYHWRIARFYPLWWRYSIGWCWINDSTVALVLQAP